MKRRLKTILDFISAQKVATTSDVHRHIVEKFQEKVARITIIRDINFLIHSGFIQKQGQERNVRYCPVIVNPLLEYFNVDDYFRNDCDNRIIKSKNFRFDVFNHLGSLFTDSELDEIFITNEKFRNNLTKLSSTIIKKEFERLTIEFSWKSSHIEGNTYSLLDTERLIKENIEANNHSREESIMILNHKRALDYIFQNASNYKDITLAKIEELHRIVIDNLGVHAGLRSSAVGIVGTNYRPFNNIHQIRDAMHELVKSINMTTNPFEKAFIVVLMIPYIQPFEDGNKRMSRILANAILLAHDYCPLSYRSVDEVEYKKAVILFYEQNSALYLKELFTEQFKQAVDKYF